MNLLVDTHILLWWLGDDPKLPGRARQAIASVDNSVLVSAATAWEISVKTAVGRLEAPDDLIDALERSDFETLDITVAHALAAGGLPAHHGDPFDRMLIAQAQIESLTIATVDERFPLYAVELLPLG